MELVVGGDCEDSGFIVRGRGRGCFGICCFGSFFFWLLRGFVGWWYFYYFVCCSGLFIDCRYMGMYYDFYISGYGVWM